MHHEEEREQRRVESERWRRLAERFLEQRQLEHRLAERALEGLLARLDRLLHLLHGLLPRRVARVDIVVLHDPNRE